MGIIFNLDNAFHLLKHSGSFSLENQDGKIDEVTQYDILSYLEIAYQDQEQFIILEAPYPIEHVQCIHAVTHGKEIEVQIAMEKDEKSYLFKKRMNEIECTEIFMNFFKYKKIPDMSDFVPVQLY